MCLRSLKRTVDNVDDAELDDPLKFDEQDKLEKAFSPRYDFTVPGTWMGYQSMLGRLHRDFTRRTHVPFIVDKVRNLEQSSLVNTGPKKQKFGKLYIAMDEGDSSADVGVTSTFAYILGLKATVMTMAVAGSYIQYSVDGMLADGDGKQLVRGW